MKRLNRMSAVAMAVGMVWLLGFAGSASAQMFMEGDDPLLVLPDVFVIIDTSGSMGWGSFRCGHDVSPVDGLGDFTCNRQTATRQVLTGTFTASAGNCGGGQVENGVMDAYKDVIRFGFATFDNNYGATWNYGDNIGNLGIKNRSTATGKLIDLVDPSDPADLIGNNARIQAAACSANASGMTPLNASLYDANYYFDNWQTETGYNDPTADCRNQFVLLMTDGGDNGPIGPYLNGPGEALRLFMRSPRIVTFVVAFGAGAAGADLIAQAGSGGLLNAFVASDPASLFLAFSVVLDSILSGSSSRTEPVSSNSNSSFDESYQYAAYFEIALEGVGWRGHLVRIPVLGIDVTGLPIYGPLSDWIYFGDELSNMNADSRKIYTVLNDPRSKTFDWTYGSPTFDSSELPRTLSTVDPNLGLVEFKANTWSAESLPLMCLNDTEGLGDPGLQNTIKDWVRGVPGAISGEGKYVRTGPVLGDIFHSNPVVVGPPSALSPDYKFESYYRQNVDRDTMLYVGANDGLLHAFVAEDNDASGDLGEEAWAFMPNNLLATIQMNRWTHEKYVDATPVVRDMYFSNIQARDLDDNLLFVGGNPVMGAYRTVLISGERGGGSAYFALDVTDPQNPGYLWEYRTDVPVTVDYSAKQCDGSIMESWATPVVGQVWLKDEHASATDPAYIGRSVAIVPGGYIPPQALLGATDCIALVEAMIGASSLHVIDVETGRLLKRFLFTESVDQDALDLLDQYYAEMAVDPSQNWNHWGGGNNFDGVGWECSGKHGRIDTPPGVPDELLNHCTIFEDDTWFRQICCWNPSGSKSCKKSALTSCYYSYEKNKTVPGGLHVFLKTEGCDLVPNHDERGRFELSLDDDFWLESVTAKPAAYNTSLGEFITRIFVPTTHGKVWRVDLGNALYNREGDETVTSGADQLIKNYDAGFRTFCWDVSRQDNESCNPAKAPVPWFDMANHGHTPRPIMVTPALALNYNQELVLFFGTGLIDNLEWTDTTDYFYGVRETRTVNADDFYEPTQFGVPCPAPETDPLNCNGNPEMMMPFDGGGATEKSERLFGKPLVVAGKVFFTTYVPLFDRCLPGLGKMYGKTFDDFDADAMPPMTMVGAGTPSQAKVAYTPAGPVVLAQQGTQLQPIPVGDAIQPATHVLHWAKVL